MAANSQYTEDDTSEYRVQEDSGIKRAFNGTDITGIFGIPYQFMESVDTRAKGTKIGSLYGEKIIARMPLLFLTPCRQVFMADYDKESKQTVLNALVSGNGLSGGLEKTLNNSSRYYSVEFAYDEYYTHVNILCSQLAYFMGIQDVYIPGLGKARDIDWSRARNEGFSRYFNISNSVVFYADGLDSMSESFSNGTTESSLASTINSFSDQAKEIRFLLGPNSALTKLAEGGAELIENSLSGLSSTIEWAVGGMIGDIANTGVSTIINGGKLLFPKIWADSTFDRSYSFDIKLRSPDADNVSIFLNILVPFVHLLAMVLPEGMSTDSKDGIIDPNGYMSPLFCKAYAKGMFNIDMGLITNMSVTRGATAQWNDAGIPTQMDISFTIEDLYSGLYMTAGETSGGVNVFKNHNVRASIVTNTAMMDYLSNLGGLNVGEQEIGRRMSLYNYLLGNATNIENKLGNVWRSFDQGFNNLIAGAYRGL